MAQVLIQKCWRGCGWSSAAGIAHSILEGSEACSPRIFSIHQSTFPKDSHNAPQLSLLPSASSLLKILLEDTQEGCVHVVFFMVMCRE